MNIFATTPHETNFVCSTKLNRTALYLVFLCAKSVIVSLVFLTFLEVTSTIEEDAGDNEEEILPGN